MRKMQTKQGTHFFLPAGVVAVVVAAGVAGSAAAAAGLGAAAFFAFPIYY